MRAVSYFLLIVVGALGVAASARADGAKFEPEQTAWGTPDIDGVWNFSTLTPIERPLAFGDKAVLTPKEAKDLLDEIRRTSPPDKPTGVAKLDVEGYNNFWFEPGDSLDKERRTSLITDPPTGRLPEIVPAARERMLAQNKQRQAPVRDILSYSVGPEYLHADPESLGLSERCLVGFNAGPPLTPGPYNNNLRIVQTPDHVVLMTEMVHDARVVTMDSELRPEDDVRQWYGVSRGHWDGNTLVVETTNFTDKTPVFQLPVKVTDPSANGVVGSARDMVVVERFTPSAEGQLHYDATVVAPKSFVQPFTLRLALQSTQDRIYEYACHEGNYALGGILRGARLREQSARDE